MEDSLREVTWPRFVRIRESSWGSPTRSLKQACMSCWGFTENHEPRGGRQAIPLTPNLLSSYPPLMSASADQLRIDTLPASLLPADDVDPAFEFRNLHRSF